MQRADKLLGLFLLCLVLVQEETAALSWTQDSVNGSTLHRCLGDNVTFPWAYVTENDEQVIAVFWSSDKNGTVASLFLGNFHASSDRISYASNASMTLSRLTSDDVGTYSVHVTISGAQQVYTHIIRLVIAEPPSLTGGHLHVKQLSAGDHSPSTGSGSEGLGVRLICGHFDSLGFPAATVVWTDPKGEQHFSAANKGGYFPLVLPARYQGGNYTCSVVLERHVAGCVGNASLWPARAGLLVETTDTRVAAQAAELGALGEAVRRLEGGGLAERRGRIDQQITNLTTRLARLEGGVKNVTAGLASQRVAAQALQDSCVQQTSRLRDAVRTQLGAQQTQWQQALHDATGVLTDKVTALSSRLTTQQRAGSDLKGVVSGLQRRQATFTTGLKQQQALGVRLHVQTEAGQRDVQQLKAAGAERHAEIVRHREALQQQEAVSANHSQALRELQEQTTVLERSVQSHTEAAQEVKAALVNQRQRLDEQTAAAAERDKRVSGLRSGQAAINASLAQQQAATQGVQTLLAEQTASLAQLTRSVAELRARQEEVIAGSGVWQEVAAVQQNLTAMRDAAQQQISDMLLTARQEMADLLAGSGSGDPGSGMLLAVEDRLRRLNASVVRTGAGLEELRSRGAGAGQLAANVTAVKQQVAALNTRMAAMEERVEAMSTRVYTVRLVGGSSEREGRVELRVGAEWGTVCDDEWGNNDAKVVCGMLGFHGTGAVARGSAAFGQGTGPIVLDDVECTGREDDIRRCNARTFGTHNCAHSEDAGVICPP